MSYGERTHLKQVLRNCRRRLHQLEQRAALEGIHTAPEVNLEIQDLKTKIRSIQRDLDNPPSPARTSGRSRQRAPFTQTNTAPWDIQNNTDVRYYPPNHSIDNEEPITFTPGIIGVGAALVIVVIVVAFMSTSLASAPKGRYITFETNRDGNSEIYSMSPDGGAQTNLTNNPANETDPNWSSDGQHIAFISSRDGNNEIYSIAIDGSQQKRLTNNTFEDGTPIWSPLGDKIAFVSNRDGESEIFVMDADGKRQVQVTRNLVNDISPTWSPDGKRLAYVSNVDGQWDIYHKQQWQHANSCN